MTELYELKYRRTAEGRSMGAPEVPDGLIKSRASYQKISDKAVKLNQVQKQSGFDYYLYWPELVTEELV